MLDQDHFHVISFSILIKCLQDDFMDIIGGNYMLITSCKWVKLRPDVG